jgi:hypothetical protein
MHVIADSDEGQDGTAGGDGETRRSMDVSESSN